MLLWAAGSIIIVLPPLIVSTIKSLPIVTPEAEVFSFILSIDRVPWPVISPVSPSINNFVPLLFFNSKSVKLPWAEADITFLVPTL